MKVFDLLSSEINTEQQPVLPSTEVHHHEVDWTQQNLLDAGQQAEIDALKAQVAALLAAPAPTTNTTGGAVKRTNTYGRMFNS